MSKLSRTKRGAKVQKQLNLSSDDFRDDPIPRRGNLIETQAAAKENKSTNPSAGDSPVLTLTLEDNSHGKNGVGKVAVVDKGNSCDAVVQQLPDCPFCGKDFRYPSI